MIFAPILAAVAKATGVAALFTSIMSGLAVLYIKFKLISLAVKVMIFFAIYLSFKAALQETILLISSKMDALSYPCTVAFVLRELQIFDMINFAVSFYAMIYISKFFYKAAIRFI